MRVPPDLETALAALAYTLCGPAPRGGAVRVAARAVGRAARDAGLTAEQARATLADAVLPVLRAAHPGAGGDWLWDRAAAMALAAYAAHGAVAHGTVAPDAIAAGPARPAAPGEEADPPVVYHLDAHDVITHVNAGWAAAAAAGAAPALADGAVGTSLWQHMRGPPLRQLYGEVHAAVRRTGRPFVLQYRCDAPGERRWMRLAVAPLGGGRLAVTSTLVERAARPPLALVDPAAPRGRGWVHMCSVCKRVRGPGGAWADPDRAAAGPTDGGAPAVPHVRHALCPDCAADLGAALGRAAA